MKNFLIICITFLLVALWVLPAYLVYFFNDGRWALLYIPIVIMSFEWGKHVIDFIKYHIE